MPHLISVRVRDDRGKADTVPIFVPSSLTVAQVQAYVDSMLPNLDVVTAAKIESVSVTLGLSVVAGLKGAAVVDRPTSMGANFGFSADGTVYRETIRVPAIDMGLVDAGVVDIADPILAPWLDDIVTGDGTAAPCDAYGNDITALLAGTMSFHKR